MPVSAVMVPIRDEAAETFRQAYLKAVKLLVTREHSRMEIETKLAKRDVPPDVIDRVVEQLQREGYQCDVRFATTLADQRLRKGFGPLSIRAKLQERGVDSAIIAEVLDELDTDWVGLATDALQSRFSPTELADGSQRQRGRVARFLQSRGFSPSVAHRALDNCLNGRIDET